MSQDYTIERRRIILIIPLLMVRGGPQRVIAGLARQLEKMGYDVRILSLVFSPQETFEDYTELSVHTVAGRKSQQLVKSVVRKFMRRLGRLQPYIGGVPANAFVTPLLTLLGYILYKPDVIILNGGHTFVGVLKLIIHKPVVLYYYGGLGTFNKNTFFSKILTPFEKASLKLCYPCVVSKELAMEFERATGIKPSTLYPIVNINHLLKLKRKDDGKTVLYIGRIAPYRKQHLLIRCYEMIIKQDLKARLIMAGTLKASDLKYYHYILNLIKKYNLTEQVLIRNVSSDQDLLALYSKASVYVNPAIETFGINVLEALAAGLPSIVYYRGAQTEIVRHKIEGFHFQNIMECAEYILRLLHERSLRISMSMNARRRALYFHKRSLNMLKHLLSSVLTQTGNIHDVK